MALGLHLIKDRQLMDLMEKDPRQDARALARARSSLYDLLALGFSPPSEELLQAWGTRLLQVLEEAEALFTWPGLKGELERLRTFAGKDQEGREKLLADLRLEYTRLFIGPYGLPVPPYESVYRERTVMGASTLDVLRRYEEAGFIFSPSFKELPDHVAVELEFLALLSSEEAEAWERGDTAKAFHLLRLEEAFLRDHLGEWIGGFSDRLVSSTEGPFYQAMAELLQAYVPLDQDYAAAFVHLLEEASNLQDRLPGEG
ncbi:MAG: molecular chaperone [Candidatus Methylomirabilales bacterium]